jgi:acetyltransferase-like isoleucine patch superfamily enzyme
LVIRQNESAKVRGNVTVTSQMGVRGWRSVDLRANFERRRFAAAMRRDVRPDRFAVFGAGSIVHPPFHADHRERVAVGESTYVLAGATISVGPEGRVAIGSRTYLGRDLTIVALSGVEIGDDVMGSDRLLFADTAPTPGRGDVPVARQGLAPGRPVRIEDGVFLGTGAMVLAGVTVGARSLVGAGAVVTHDVPPNSVVVGNPGRIVRHFDAARGAWVDGQPA